VNASRVPLASRAISGVVVLLFFTSGLASLVLETVWVRMMVLVFGSTTFALSTVLTAFMGGLALGAFVAGRRAGRLTHPNRALLAYGLLELGVGAYALLLPHVVERIHVIHAVVWGTSHSSYYTFALLRFLLAGTLLLLPTVAMGATLPVLAHFFCAGRPTGDLGRRVGTLYAVNTTGAVVGVLLAGFVLLPRVGMAATNLVACLADLTLGVAALVLLRILSTSTKGTPDARPATTASPDTTAPPERVSHHKIPSWIAALAVASIGVSGALAMVYQVAWTRAMSLIIGSSTYAFSLILVCFLVGLAAGAALYARRQAHQPDQAANLAVVHLLVAVTACAGLLFMDYLPAVLVTLLRRIELAPAVVFLLKFLVVGTVILLPTFFMGMVFPAVLALVDATRRGPDAARTTGNVYAVNTLGSIAGSFAGGFVLIPLLGLQQTLVASVACGLLLAALFGLLAARPGARLVLAGAAMAAALGNLALVRPWNLELMTSGVFRVSRYEGLLGEPRAPRKTQPSSPEGTLARAARRLVPPSRVVDTSEEPGVGYAVVFHREGVTTTVSLARTVEDSLSSAACWVRHSLLVNGKPDASLSVLHRRPPTGCQGLRHGSLQGPGLAISPSGDAETQILSGLLPLALYPARRPPESVLVIGWGSGITVGAALQGPIRSLVAVELEREVLEAARHFEPHNHVPQRDPRLRLVNEDGRNYLAVSPQRYDVIVSEPSNPWIAGCGNLFTREFFELVRRRLQQDGVYLQWLQAYEIAPDNVWSILGTLSDVFPATYVFRPVQSSADLLIVARKRPGKLDWSTIAQHLSHPGIRRELLARLLAGTAGVRRTTAGAPRNTDDNARIEFATPKDLINYKRYSSKEIARRLGSTLVDPRREIRGPPPDISFRLCRGLLRAGRPREAARLDRSDADEALRACRAAARRLSEPFPKPTAADLRALLQGDPALDAMLELLGKPPEAAIDAMERVYARRRDPPFALAGHFYALAQRPFPALALLTAGEETGRAYPPLSHLLALLYQDRGRYDLALRRVEEGE
jgi:spermidine synthase